MTRREQLLDLRDRLAAATHGTFALECEIASLLTDWTPRQGPPRNYSVSIDSAVTLVPEDPANPGKPMLWSIAYDEDGVAGARSYLASLGKGYHDPQYIYGHSDATPALALCLARVEYELSQTDEAQK